MNRTDAVLRFGPDGAPVEADAAELEIWSRVRSCTMTGPERIAAAVRSADYVAARGIDGDIVECGVWRGGSMMAMALALLRRGDTQRTLYLYDTFAGMSAPSVRDVQFDGASAADLLARSPADSLIRAVAALDEVRRNLSSTGYPSERIRFVKGPVEETIPHIMPEAIAILRLDTDWYKSTRHELIHLYPRLREGGVLIIDDYGHWRGSRDATDEFCRALAQPPALHPIDYTGVIAVKPQASGR